MNFLRNLIILLVFLPLSGQEIQIQKEKNLWNDFTYDMGNVFGGIGHAYSRPFHWKGKDWANFGYLTAGTAMLFTVDDELDNWVDGFRDDVPDLIIDYGNEYGSPENNYMLTGGVYLAGLFTKNEKLRRTGVLLIASATAGGFLQQVSKRIIGRARPKSGDSSSVYDPFHLDRVRNYDSFPSGHAILAFSNAYAIAKQFKSPWVKAGIYTVGMIPGFSRIMDGFHWVSDVAFGTVLSIFIVESIDRYLDSKYDQKYNASEKKLSWNLNFGPGTMGVVVRF
ncbi:phosphatase PAP2 family protein [Flagellimonas allohymeniacidonis]|uniref:Phosphatase PAP2 family protein n=1 Tax=Flagellimonas allohymeniacidonis TaxID=2517819 RepID=A0A4Q8QDR4_9FLAO|nr:phosphatase PAP2 family protein [Allomuricauda hymeniacidonis]TAI47258.1 phosphatase PAP2 family protein [Allomuricauda hymeniacidonis]